VYLHAIGRRVRTLFGRSELENNANHLCVSSEATISGTKFGGARAPAPADIFHFAEPPPMRIL
jgi:hypothetical protein